MLYWRWLAAKPMKQIMLPFCSDVRDDSSRS